MSAKKLYYQARRLRFMTKRLKDALQSTIHLEIYNYDHLHMGTSPIQLTITARFRNLRCRSPPLVYCPHL